MTTEQGLFHKISLIYTLNHKGKLVSNTKTIVMKYKTPVFLLIIGLLSIACSTDADTAIQDDFISEQTAINLYFPPLNSTEWETTTLTELKWNEVATQALYTFLEEKNTKAFIVLKNGRIAVEWYGTDFTQDSPWYWASAGKTLTSFTTGIAQEEGFLALTDKSSDYLGEGWTSLTTEKEGLITVWNQLSMTTGMDDTQGDCKTPDCLTYITDAGTRWSYHNAPYTLLQDVITNASNTDFPTYFNTKLRDRIGMTGQWFSTNESNNVYWSTARSMARFGLLNLNNGVWDETTILGDTSFLKGMKNTSQPLNKSYGYLWWLNGKESAMIPQSQVIFETTLMPNAPEDLYAGLGKNDQKLYIVPSQNLVIVRMGEDTGVTTLGPSSFDNELWELINSIIY
jgi:CubicO group peptidase (beta-lactamase class C family)